MYARSRVNSSLIPERGAWGIDCQTCCFSHGRSGWWRWVLGTKLVAMQLCHTNVEHEALIAELAVPPMVVWACVTLGIGYQAFCYDVISFAGEACVAEYAPCCFAQLVRAPLKGYRRICS